MSEKIAFVIGNGTSRKQFDLRKLKGVGNVFGCNALYREYAPNYDLPDYLVAIDPGMIQEIQKSDFPKDRFIIPALEQQWEPKEVNPNRPRSNAGVNAILEALRLGHDTIFLLGFDFMLSDKSQSVSNMFDGTQNYGHEVRARYEENVNRARYLDWACNLIPKTNFYLVFPDEVYSDIRSNLLHLNSWNVRHTTYTSLEKNITQD